MRHCLFLFVLLCGWSFVSSPAYAVCVALYFTNVPAASTFSSTAGEYRVFDPATHPQSFNVTVNAIANVLPCHYYITVSAGASGNTSQRHMAKGADTLRYNIYTSAAMSNVLNNTGSHGGGTVISGTFGAVLGLLQTRTHQIHWTIEPEQVKAADTNRFQDTVEISLWVAGVSVPSAQQNTTLRTRTESDIDISLVNTGQPFNLYDTTQSVSFGDLYSGATQGYDTVVRSNDGYHITMESDNAQTMRHANYPTVSSIVNYTTSFGGTAVNLSGGTPVTARTASGVTSKDGARFPTQFTIGTMSGAEAPGVYQDTITLTVSAN
jgi:spore coat protein U-like protein